MDFNHRVGVALAIFQTLISESCLILCRVGGDHLAAPHHNGRHLVLDVEVVVCKIGSGHQKVTLPPTWPTVTRL